MIVHTTGGEYNYVGSIHHIPLHVIKPSHKKVAKRTLHKPQLKSWWYLHELYTHADWCPAMIIQQVSDLLSHGVAIEFYDSHNDQYIQTTVFDRRFLKFSENA